MFSFFALGLIAGACFLYYSNSLSNELYLLKSYSYNYLYLPFPPFYLDS